MVDFGSNDSGVANNHLQAYLDAHTEEYVLEGLSLQFLSLSKPFEEDLIDGN